MAAEEAGLLEGSGRGDIALAFAAFGIAFVLCLPALHGLSGLLQHVEHYGHAILLPLVAAYLVYGNRREIRRCLRDLRPPAFGGIVVLAAASFQVLAVMGDVAFAAGIGVPLVLGSTAYAVGGPALLRSLMLPLVFLALMVPPPGILMQEALFRLKLLVTDVAVAVLQATGAPVYAEGNQLSVPGHTLFVADACSGLTSIVTMLPLGVVVAYFLSHGVWRRALIIGSVVPLAMAANILRVIVTVKLVSIVGTEAAQGLLHDSFGIATYAGGTLALIVVARLLR